MPGGDPDHRDCRALIFSSVAGQRAMFDSNGAESRYNQGDVANRAVRIFSRCQVCGDYCGRCADPALILSPREKA